MPITTIDDLRTHLQWAIEVEHSTIPPYLYAYYSLQEPTNQVGGLIRSVVLEEMLHLSIVCNVLNAIGGTPQLGASTFTPTYPGPLPHHAPDPPLTVNLAPLSVDVVNDTFLAIEKPESPGDIPEDDNFTSLAQLYAAISAGLTDLNATLGPATLFCGDPKRQVTDIWLLPPDPSASDLFPVTDLKSALEALNIVVEQGEGSSETEFDPDGELSHYWKFNQIVDGTIPIGAVVALETNPSTAALPNGTLKQLSQVFDDAYGLLLRTLHQIFNGAESNALSQGALFPLMLSVITPLAKALTTLPTPDNPNLFAGPAFEFSDTPQPEILTRLEALVASAPTIPGLSDVVTVVKALPPIDSPAT